MRRRHWGLAGSTRPIGRAHRPLVEVMESRRLLSIMVTKTVDDGSAGTLREAINQANASIGPAEIDFAIPGTGVHTIALTSDLPALTHPLTIDGTTQPGSNPGGLPSIELAGTFHNATGLDFAPGSDGGVLKGLLIHGFSTAAVLVSANSITIAGNVIGTDATGTLSVGNGNGIEIHGANNRIGGTTAADRNVISGNAKDGIRITGTSATGNLVEGNFLGTDFSGADAVGNLSAGLVIDNAPGNTIGGDAPGAGNVIAGNGAPEDPRPAS